MTTLVRESELPQQQLGALKGLFGRVKTPSIGISLVALLAVVVACCIVMILWSVSIQYRPLYGAQENFDSAQVIEILEAEGRAYQISPQDGTVLVQADQVGEVRMLMAARGVQARLPNGFDSFNSDMTTSQFMEQARYRQGLEGELARTIMGLQQVRSARVHLAVPKTQVFMRSDDPKPTASVMVELESGAQLGRSEVAGIVNLVAGSVTGLATARVRVVDQQGQLLSGDQTSAGLGMSDQHTQFRQQLEQSLVERASTMLEPLLGFGNFRVQVSAQVNFDKVNETRESIDPNPVVRQESTNLISRLVPDPVGIPGALSNLPAGQGQAEPGSSEITNQDEQIKRQFEVGRAITRTQKQQGLVEQLSISVLLNDAVVQAQNWEQAQLDSVAVMVQDAVGYQTQRSDKFSLATLPFQVAQPVTVVEPPWWQQAANQLYLRIGIGVLLTLLMLLLVVRPLVRSITRNYDQQQQPTAGSDKASASHIGVTEPMPEQGLMAATGSDAPPLAVGNNDDGTIPGLALVPASDASLDTQLQHLGMLAGQEPEKVAEVIEQMLSGGERPHER
ncbi:flagellar basal-body MS-ring/collar protein FliF [uncultured Ferrimonas sp.]|uniref:flagellar basal-body MS-ring/collar protein FliF n=1 Tax=uncultured Ferrimonas sp. TaxID=432640 RepID=UPI00262A07B2|nr:flagellar basal-body MS-ring/collar protein FliF [uncultured Ferrimonas sp.]